jgi:hypothetical protein
LENKRAKIQELIRKYESQLLKYPNVIGVSTGHKIVNGINTEELCISILVRKKISEEELDSKYVLPKDIESIKTDVVDVRGDIKTQS